MKTLKTILLVGSLAVSGFAAAAPTDEEIATLRHSTSIEKQSENVERMGKVINTDERVERNYPMQPPLIPHKIDNYEVSTNSNKCMTCHSRQNSQDAQAPMVSVTHYMNSEGNFLAEISPRRYFCSQCHVVQIDAKPLIDNEFIDMHSLMKQKISKK